MARLNFKQVVRVSPAGLPVRACAGHQARNLLDLAEVEGQRAAVGEEKVILAREAPGPSSINMFDPMHLPNGSPDDKGDSLPSYLSRLTSVPLLSPEEERALARRARAGDQVAKMKLVEANMRLVVNIAKNYRHRSIAFEDLVQEGALGLIDAVERFDPERGFRFSTYATHWIRQTIGRAIDSKAKTIRIPAHVSDAIRKMERERARLASQLGREPSAAEIAETLGISKKKLLLILQSAQDPVSIDRMVGEDESIDFTSRIADENSVDPEETIMNKESMRSLYAILDQLSERERRVMSRRLGLDETYTSGSVLKEMSSELQLSRERIRQIELQAVRKLRSLMKRRRPSDPL